MAAKTWFHYGDMNPNTHVLKPLRICNGHTRGVEGVSPCYDLRLLKRRARGHKNGGR